MQWQHLKTHNFHLIESYWCYVLLWHCLYVCRQWWREHMPRPRGDKWHSLYTYSRAYLFPCWLIYDEFIVLFSCFSCLVLKKAKEKWKQTKRHILLSVSVRSVASLSALQLVPCSCSPFIEASVWFSKKQMRKRKRENIYPYRHSLLSYVFILVFLFFVFHYS